MTARTSLHGSLLRLGGFVDQRVVLTAPFFELCDGVAEIVASAMDNALVTVEVEFTGWLLQPTNEFKAANISAVYGTERIFNFQTEDTLIAPLFVVAITHANSLRYEVDLMDQPISSRFTTKQQRILAYFYEKVNVERGLE